MATTTETKTTVAELTKFGFKDASGLYVGYSPKMPEKDKALVVPGRTLEVEMYVADSGKQYVNKVLSAPVTKREVTTKPSTLPVKEVKKLDEAMTRADWDAKDVRISRQGVIQAAYKVASAIAPAPKLKEIAYRIADEMLEYIRNK
jgi:hypothetical protein